MLPNRDSVGGFSKFNTPIVANGKVYIATFSNRLNVYGLLPTSSGMNTKNDYNFFVNIYPNPADINVTLNYTLIHATHNLKMILVDLYGRKILNIPLSATSGEHTKEIQLPENISAGVYHAMFYADERLVSVTKLAKY